MTAAPGMLADPLLHVSESFLRDPYPYYKQLRDSDPVYWSQEGNYWIITRYADADFVLRDLRFGKGMPLVKSQLSRLGRLFFQLAPSAMLIGQPGQSMLHQNPPDHTRMRGLVNKAFTPKMVEQMRAHIQQIADDLLNKVESRGEMDLVQDYAFPLPVTVIAEMLGIPPEDQARFQKWSRGLTAVLEPGANVAALVRAAFARNALVSYLKPLIEERRKEQRQDLISSLVEAEEAGNKLTEQELLSNVVLLLVAGHETTVNLISNSALALMTHPDQKQLLISKPELINNAVDEFLRWMSPVQIVRRVANEDVEIGGKKIKTGQVVIISVGAANRDPERYPNPDKLDITRSDIKHLAFGIGIHHCLGYALAQAEGQISLATLLKRWPDTRLLVAPETIEWKRPFSLRGPKQLPVSFHCLA